MNSMISGSYRRRPKRIRYSGTCVQLGDLVAYCDETVSYQISFEFWGLGMVVEKPYKCSRSQDSDQICCKVLWLRHRYVEEMLTNFLEVV